MATAAFRRPGTLRPPRILLVWLLCLLVTLAAAQELVAIPPLQTRVTDLTGTLSAERIAALDAQLRAFEEREGVQIAVLMVRSTRPEAIEQYALRVVEQWKLGRRKVDDGALLLVAKDDRAVRIEVGYGIEGTLSDVVARRIIDETITPRFRQGDFYAGIASGIDQVMRVVDGEPLPAAQRRARGTANDIGQSWPFLFVMALFLGGVARQMFGRLPGAVVVGGLLGVGAWLVVGTLAIAGVAGLAGFLVTLLGIGMGGHGGTYGHHRGGGWPGAGGGGFRGGGGGFGGGGASGRW